MGWPDLFGVPGTWGFYGSLLVASIVGGILLVIICGLIVSAIDEF